jgi:enamine deaminase RidA (YjgF/YER057c/UK114 family)
MLKDILLIATPSGSIPEEAGSHALGTLLYTRSIGENTSSAERFPVRLNVPMRHLDSQKWTGELFAVDQPVKQGQYGNINYCHDGSILFGTLVLDESRYTDPGHPPLQAATRDAYSEIFKLLQTTGYSAVFRFWNYMANINEHTHGLERYRQFNFGRQEAFANQGALSKDSIPAACALGFAEGPLTVAFMAGKGRITAVENPRQVSAYDYPTQYGPRSPLFSRASLVEHGGKEILFLSGTASILGHETLHADDVVKQTRESIFNIQAVLDEANKKSSQGGYTLDSFFYTVYVRCAEDLHAVRNELKHAIGREPHAIYLQADICRRELLVEIEGVSRLSS